MVSKNSLTSDVISQAESYDGIRAGIIRLNDVLQGDFEPTAALHGFAPCDTCDVFCQKACPVKAFPAGKYSRPNCRQQMDDDWNDPVPEGEIGETGKRNRVVRFCRACEFSCPVGA